MRRVESSRSRASSSHGSPSSSSPPQSGPPRYPGERAGEMRKFITGVIPRSLSSPESHLPPSSSSTMEHPTGWRSSSRSSSDPTPVRTKRTHRLNAGPRSMVAEWYSLPICFLFGVLRGVGASSHGDEVRGCADARDIGGRRTAETSVHMGQKITKRLDRLALTIMQQLCIRRNLRRNLLQWGGIIAKFLHGGCTRIRTDSADS